MRNSMTFTSLLAVLFLHSAAFAQSSIADNVVTKLQDDGYTVTEVRRSWLGRIVITASSTDELREVVLNRTSGEILRDQTFPIEHQSEGASAPLAVNPDDKVAPNGPPKPDAPGGKGGSGNGGGSHGKNGGGGHGGNG